ncbi:unnamed protein product [Pedinophyceae sp. YPF-701]|nr:unnamed protein product [Pedinophyceae sp. YPF-701]
MLERRVQGREQIPWRRKQVLSRRTGVFTLPRAPAHRFDMAAEVSAFATARLGSASAHADALAADFEAVGLDLLPNPDASACKAPPSETAVIGTTPHGKTTGCLTCGPRPPTTHSGERPLLSLQAINHISKVCRDVRASANFYKQLLGFQEVSRPSSFDFNGAWLHGCGMGLHLIQGEPDPRKEEIDPKSDHISFQSDDLAAVESTLESLGVGYVKQLVREGPYLVTQLFFHDPDRNMIEVCDCHQLPLEFLTSNGWLDQTGALAGELGEGEERVVASRKFSPHVRDSGANTSELQTRAASPKPALVIERHDGQRTRPQSLDWAWRATGQAPPAPAPSRLYRNSPAIREAPEEGESDTKSDTKE